MANGHLRVVEWLKEGPQQGQLVQAGNGIEVTEKNNIDKQMICPGCDKQRDFRCPAEKIET